MDELEQAGLYVAEECQDSSYTAKIDAFKRVKILLNNGLSKEGLIEYIDQDLAILEKQAAATRERLKALKRT